MPLSGKTGCGSLASRLFIFLLVLAPVTVCSQVRRAAYLDLIRQSAEKGWQDLPASLEQWKKNPNHSELWGYDSPGHPLYLADALGFLFNETRERKYGERARDILLAYGDLRSTYSPELASKRIEYRSGVPAVANFFILPPYARAWSRIRESDVVDARTRARIDTELGESLEAISSFPEWGAHNRAMLRAESLLVGSRALAGDPRSTRWQKMANSLASDSVENWEIEDAAGYNAIWLYSVFSYLTAAGREDLLLSPQIKYYLDYYVQLLSPLGTLPDFGDANWNEANVFRFIPVFEKAASLYHNESYRYFAATLLRHHLKPHSFGDGTQMRVPGSGEASFLVDAYNWANDEIQAKVPTGLSRPVLDDIVGKKLVFRDGWKSGSTMMLLNYRDEGDGGVLGRDYLRQTLSVEEEKMHHGHADENSVAFLASGDSVLLTDAGYRPALPSGPNGEWRADYFHNRLVARTGKPGRESKLIEFLRNSGAYRPVKTQQIDFRVFAGADYGRTRLIDEGLGYEADRVVVFLRKLNVFVIVDSIKITRTSWFTFANLWHTRQIDGRQGNSFLTHYDQVGSEHLTADTKLQILFASEGVGKSLGSFQINRHGQDEQAIYQMLSGSFKAGDRETFVTVLHPQASNADPASFMDSVHFVQSDKPHDGIGVELVVEGVAHLVCVKTNLDLDTAVENIRPRYSYELGRIRYGGLETDAGFVYASFDSRHLSYSASTLTRLVFNGKSVFGAQPNTFGLQLDGGPSRYGFAKWRSWEDEVDLR